MMRLLTTCLLVATAIQSSLGQNTLTMKFAPVGVDPNRLGSFFGLPRSLDNKEFAKDGWELTDKGDLKTEGVSVYCRNKDPRACLLMDRKGSVAGVQLSVPVGDLKKTNAPLHPPMAQKTVLGTEVYSTRIFFVNPTTLRAGGRSLNATTLTAPDGIYVPTPHGGFRKIPNNEEDITKNSLWVKGGCIPNMGRHYFYNVSKQLKCEEIEIFFALYDEKTHKLVGSGFVIRGVASTQEGGRSWFENPSASITRVIAPEAPDCAVELANKHGLTAAHVYTGANEPWNLRC